MTSTATHVRADRSAELHRLMDGDQLARPERPLGEGTAGRRDPSPTWDPWYSLPLTQRRQLLRFMAPAGHGLQLDQVAQLIGAGDLEHALRTWARACDMARRGATGWETIDAAEWEAADLLAEQDAELYGPAGSPTCWGSRRQRFTSAGTVANYLRRT